MPSSATENSRDAASAARGDQEAGSRSALAAAGVLIYAGVARSSTGVALVAAVTVAALPTVIAALRARQPAAMWWRPAVALLLSPLGVLAYWAYSAVRLRNLGGFTWLEKNGHDSFDWGQGVFLSVKDALFDRPSAVEVMTLLVLAAAVVLTICSLTERFPWSMHVYTLAIVVIALGGDPSTSAPSRASCSPPCCSACRWPGSLLRCPRGCWVS